MGLSFLYLQVQPLEDLFIFYLYMQVFDGENAHSSSSFLSDAVIIAKNISNLNSNVSCPLYHARAEESASFFV